MYNNEIHCLSLSVISISYYFIWHHIFSTKLLGFQVSHFLYHFINDILNLYYTNKLLNYTWTKAFITIKIFKTQEFFVIILEITETSKHFFHSTSYSIISYTHALNWESTLFFTPRKQPSTMTGSSENTFLFSYIARSMCIKKEKCKNK